MNNISTLLNAVINDVIHITKTANDSAEAEDAMSSYTGMYMFDAQEFYDHEEEKFKAKHGMGFNEAYRFVENHIGSRLAAKYFQELSSHSYAYHMDSAVKARDNGCPWY